MGILDPSSSDGQPWNCQDGPVFIPTASHCSRCGDPVLVAISLVIAKLDVGADDAVTIALPAHEQKHGLHCRSCTLNHVEESNRADVSQRYDGMLAIRESLQLTGDELLQHIVQYPRDNPASLERFLLEMLAIPVQTPLPVGVPQLHLRVLNDIAEVENVQAPSSTYLVVLRSVGISGVSTTLRVQWDFDRGDGPLEIDGWKEIETQGQFGQLMEGVQLLRSFTRRGRPKGSTGISEEEFRARLPLAYYDWIDQMGYRPTQGELATEFSIPERTFRRYLTRYALAWPPEKST